MDLGIKGRVALVTGGGKGLGRAIGEALAAEGCQVVLVSRTPLEVETAALAIREAGGAAVAFPLDITDGPAVAEFFAELERREMAIDILINNANVNIEHYLEFAEIPIAQWLWVFEQNMAALAHVTQRVLPGMVARGWGRVVNIGSIAGVIGGAKQVPYATLKASLEGFSRSLALEVSKEGVTVNVVHPGLVMTERTEGKVKDKARKWIELKTATRKLSTPDDVAAMVAFLASNRAGNITGASIPVSGGVELGFSL